MTRPFKLLVSTFSILWSIHYIFTLSIFCASLCALVLLYTCVAAEDCFKIDSLLWASRTLADRLLFDLSSSMESTLIHGLLEFKHFWVVRIFRVMNSLLRTRVYKPICRLNRRLPSAHGMRSEEPEGHLNYKLGFAWMVCYDCQRQCRLSA